MKKAKQNLLVVCIMAVMIQPIITKAQSTTKPWSKSESNNTNNTSTANKNQTKIEGWQFVNFDGKGSYVRNGVEFYKQSAECNSAKTNLLKLVNTNNYAVKVSYQLSDISPVVNIMVAASATLEGACGVTDGNLAKLVINNPPVGKTDEEKQKNKDFFRSHIVVSQIK
jgi:hypothetical protein